MTHPSCGSAGNGQYAAFRRPPHFPIRRSSSVILRQSTHCRPVGAYPFSPSGPAQTKGTGNGNRHNIFSRGRRNRGAPCQALQSSPCRPSGILRRQNAAEKRAHKPHPQLRGKRRAPASRTSRHRRKGGSRGSLGEHPDILIAECRDFLDFLHFLRSNPKFPTKPRQPGGGNVPVAHNRPNQAISKSQRHSSRFSHSFQGLTPKFFIELVLRTISANTGKATRSAECSGLGLENPIATTHLGLSVG